MKGGNSLTVIYRIHLRALMLTSMLRTRTCFTNLKLKKIGNVSSAYHLTSIVPMLTPRLHFKDALENNQQATTIFDGLSHTRLFMIMYIIRKTLKHLNTTYIVHQLKFS